MHTLGAAIDEVYTKYNKIQDCLNKTIKEMIRISNTKIAVRLMCGGIYIYDLEDNKWYKVPDIKEQLSDKLR